MARRRRKQKRKPKRKPKRTCRSGGCRLQAEDHMLTGTAPSEKHSEYRVLRTEIPPYLSIANTQPIQCDHSQIPMNNDDNNNKKQQVILLAGSFIHPSIYLQRCDQGSLKKSGPGHVSHLPHYPPPLLLLLLLLLLLAAYTTYCT